ncbi:MAG: ADP-ribosyltransferase [Bacteroidetes bacterium]|nr:ADP-ribosyltransferase [Bacteroidota bacterium]
MALTLLDSIDIYFGSTKRTLQLCQGDLSNMTPQDAVDFLVVSALPGDYSPTSGSLIGALNQHGVSVAALSQNKAANYEPTMPCWVSQQVVSTNPGIQFKRILLFEPPNPATEAIAYVESIFKGLDCFQSDTQSATAAMPMVCTGSGGASDADILTALFYAAVHWQVQSFPLNIVKLTVYQQDQVAPLKALFATHKSNYTNLRTLNLPGGYSGYANSAWSIVSGMTLPAYLTQRQAFGICVYTSNYYMTINSVLRTKQWTDPEYQQMLPLFESIDSGLANIPPFVGLTYRGESNMSSQRLAEYVPGNDVTALAYTSTAYVQGGWYNKKYQFDINSLKGSKIDNYSIFPSEKEVVYHRELIEHVNTKNANSYGGFKFGIDEKVINYCGK